MIIRYDFYDNGNEFEYEPDYRDLREFKIKQIMKERQVTEKEAMSILCDMTEEEEDELEEDLEDVAYSYFFNDAMEALEDCDARCDMWTYNGVSQSDFYSGRN